MASDSDPTIAALAGKLTGGEVAAILSTSDAQTLIGCGYALGRHGLAQLDDRVTPHRFYFTPLGLAVREHLLAHHLRTQTPAGGE